MSTRSAIGTIDKTTGECRLTFHHWDGYPSGVGQTIWKLYHGTEKGSEKFKGNLPAILEVLLAHTWSSINGHNWQFDPGYVEHNSPTGKCRDCGRGQYDNIHFGVNANGHQHNPTPEAARPQCYCHGDGNEPLGEPLKLAQVGGMGAEYVYLLDANTNTLSILSSYVPDDAPETFAGQKMVGFFGVGYANSEWRPLAILALDGPEPVWEQIGAEDDDDEEPTDGD